MGAISDLQAAGFSQQEIDQYVGQQRDVLRGAGFSDSEIGDYLGEQPQPSTQDANHALSRTIGNAMRPALQTTEDIASVYAPVETILNVGTGLLFGFPAYVGSAVGGLADKYLLGQDVDPKQMAETVSKAFTYIPQTERGKRLTGNVMLPLRWLSDFGEFSGHAVARGASAIGATTNVAAASGAVTDSAIQAAPMFLMGAFGRRIANRVPTTEDFSNVAKHLAGDSAPPEKVAATEANLRETYAQMGIDPFSVAQDAANDARVAKDITTQNVGTPPKYVVAYHGSPHEFNEFDLAKIGSGEGAQSFGHGIYLAESKGVASGYRVSTGYADLVRSFKNALPEDASEEELSAALEKGELDPSVAPIIRELKANDWLGFDYPAQAITQAFKGLDGFDVTEGLERAVSEYGNVYKVHVHGSAVNGMLDWDKPLSQQVPAVQQAIKDAGLWPGDEAAPVTSGGKFYKDLAAAKARVEPVPNTVVGATRRVGGPETASALLRDAGVPGIKYLDAMSRASGEGTRNLVLFDPRDAMIVERNGIPVEAPSIPPEAKPGAGEPLLDYSGPTHEEIAQAASEPQVVNMNLGINPADAASAYAKSYTPYVGVESPKGTGKTGGVLDSLQHVIAPASRGPEAELQAGIMRANLGEMAHQREVALENLKDFAATFDKRSVGDNYKFIDAMEHGAQLSDPRMQAAADAIRQLLDQKRTEVQELGLGKLDSFIENYFPHIWKDEKAAQAFYSRRPLTGSGAFLKERTFDYFKDGLDAGLKPVTDNPVELALLKAREMDRFIYGQRIFQEMKDSGLARFVRFGDRAPDGWAKINDKVARVFQYSEAESGMILRGEYYAPEQAATLINNHLSPGLQGSGAFQAWRRVGMAMNSLQLGLSAFHVGFTTLDSMISRVALGIKQAARGDVVEGIGNAALGSSPAQPFINIYKGDRLLRAYLGTLDNPDLAPVVDAIQQAGGRVKMDDFYRNATVNAFKQAIRQKAYGTAAKEFLPTVLDRVSAPIFEWLVPRQKLGVFFDMAKDWIEKNPEADVATKRAELGRLWDSVDNRMGQLVYDNVFWNRSLKDGLLATVRSVGWNLGTFRELGGGVKDIVPFLKGAALSDRTAYVAALPLVAGLYGALTQFAYTGQGPRDLKDLFFPRTGRIRPDGSEDRVSLPTYMKDVYAYGEDVASFARYGTNPLTTLENKAHPLISTVAQMLNNEDYYGANIRNPSAPIVGQVKDEAEYFAKQIEPFSLRNYQQQAKLREQEPGIADYLTSPSMFGVTPAPGYITKSDEEKESEAVGRLRDPLMRRFRNELRAGADLDEVIPQMLTAGFNRRDIEFVVRTSGDFPLPHRMKSFGNAEATQ